MVNANGSLLSGGMDSFLTDGHDGIGGAMGSKGSIGSTSAMGNSNDNRLMQDSSANQPADFDSVFSVAFRFSPIESIKSGGGSGEMTGGGPVDGSGLQGPVDGSGLMCNQMMPMSNIKMEMPMSNIKMEDTGPDFSQRKMPSFK
jgi:hypothetical protein